ncbi:MAG TPA: 3-hydroxybutyryl-CoA dehydrogenase, partial [Actinobacteria bacterium]|nr:3-hydroxybutyryl-CoA dehydrogenase [Actinomycetota bacterium]
MAVNKMAVVGCGIMGCGIIQVAVQSGIEAVGVETSEAGAQRARDRINAGLDGTLKRGKITEEQAAKARELFSITTDLGAVAGADLVVEAVYEDVELKNDILGRIDKLVGPETFIASNTSTIPLVILAAATTRPERVVGLHFFNPVPAMKLVEVIKTPVTSDEDVTALVELTQRMGKSPVVVNDGPGFIGNLLI